MDRKEVERNIGASYAAFLKIHVSSCLARRDRERRTFAKYLKFPASWLTRAKHCQCWEGIGGEGAGEILAQMRSRMFYELVTIAIGFSFILKEISIDN